MKDELNLKAIRELIEKSGLNYDMKLLDSVDSTNLEAIRSYHNDGNLCDRTVFAARAQTGGIGRLSHKWYSPSESIFMTIFLKPEECVENLSKLTLMTGVSVCRTIRRISNVQARLKRPNDIVIVQKGLKKSGSASPPNGECHSDESSSYAGLKKLAGILSKSNFSGGKLNYVIIGLGLNVNVKNFPDELSELATSIALESRKYLDLNKLIVEIIRDFDKYYKTFLNNQDFFLSEYEDLTIGL